MGNPKERFKVVTIRKDIYDLAKQMLEVGEASSIADAICRCVRQVLGNMVILKLDDFNYRWTKDGISFEGKGLQGNPLKDRNLISIDKRLTRLLGKGVVILIKQAKEGIGVSKQGRPRRKRWYIRHVEKLLEPGQEVILTVREGELPVVRSTVCAMGYVEVERKGNKLYLRNIDTYHHVVVVDFYPTSTGE